MDTKTDRSIARALDWARIHAGEHADTIIEALAAYDPERAVARTVSRAAQAPERRASAASEAADAQLADTQRAIIEAAEARGYARAKAEADAEARELVRIPWTYNYWSEGVFGSPTNAANIVAYNGEDVAAIAYVPDAGERARIIEKHNNIVRRIEALAAQQRKGG